MPVTRAPFDLLALLRRVSVMLSVEACRKGLRLAVHLGPDVPRMVVGDERHLEEVLVNLASNAVKFTAEGHVLISVERADGDEAEGQIRLAFSVADTGIGIAPEAQARVFESFPPGRRDHHRPLRRHRPRARDRAATGGDHGRARLLVLHARVGSTFAFDALFAVAEAPPRPSGDRSCWSRPTAPSRRPSQPGGLGSRRLDLGEAAEILAAEAGGRQRAAAGARRRADRQCFAGRGHDTPSFRHNGRGGDDRDRGSPRGRAGSLRCSQDQGRRACPPPPRPDMLAMIEPSSVRRRPPPKSRGRSRAGFAPLRVLVAEDNKTNQLVLGKLLETAVSLRRRRRRRTGDRGAEGRQLRHRADGRQHARHERHRGDQALPASCRSAAPRIPIVALTADATPEARARCLDAGMDACATKPIDFDRLMAVIEAAMKGAAPPSPRDASADLRNRAAEGIRKRAGARRREAPGTGAARRSRLRGGTGRRVPGRIRPAVRGPLRRPWPTRT